MGGGSSVRYSVNDLYVFGLCYCASREEKRKKEKLKSAKRLAIPLWGCPPPESTSLAKKIVNRILTIPLSSFSC